MKNKYFKSAIISSAIAITTGVLLFGINAAFGAPTYDPPGSDVRPTFNGMNVTGDIMNPSTGTVTVKGDLSIIGNGFLNILGNFTIGKADGITRLFNLYGNAFLNGSLSVNTGTTLKGALDAQGGIYNSLGALIFDDDTTFNKKLTVIGDFITNKATTVTLGDQTNTGTTVNVGGGIQMIGNLTRFIAGLTSIRGNDNVLAITSSKTGDVSSAAASLALDPNTKTAIFSTKYIKSSTGTPLEVLGGLKVSTALDVTNIKNSNSAGSAISIDNPLNVNGKITSAGFGTYTFRQSAFVPLAGGSHSYAALACNTGEVLVSCFSNAFGTNTGADFWTGENFDDVTLTALYPWVAKCEANYKNTSGVTKYVKVGAMCFNPSL